MNESQFFDDESEDSAFPESKDISTKSGETKPRQGLWSRVLNTPSLGRTFFRKDHSERQHLLLGEFLSAAVNRAGGSALSFLIVASLLTYFAFEVNRSVIGIIIFALGLLASLVRLTLRRRYGCADLSDPAPRRLVHIELIVASTIGSLMWGIAIASVYPALHGDLRSVFLLLLVGSVMVGSVFMTLAPPSYLIHLSVVLVTFTVTNYLHPTQNSVILVVLLALCALELFKSSYRANMSLFNVASRLAKVNSKHAQRHNRMQQKIIDGHAKAETTLRASAEARNLFLAKVSHEFRAPLQGILGASELLSALLERNDDPRIARTIRSLNSSSTQLLAISNDLADYLKSNSTQVRIKAEHVELIEFLDQCVATQLPMAQKKGLTVRFTHPDTAIEYITDSVRLRQIVTNLLSNAVKYTTLGSIDLECQREANGQIAIQVRDTGIGISEQGMKSIFEPWFRADETKQGMGLGLAIVKATADAIGAKVQITSEPEVGTTVTLTLPPGRVNGQARVAPK